MRTPGGLQGLFFVAMLLFTGAIGILGWRLLEQDRALAKQRRQEQLEAAADRTAGALFLFLTDLEDLLRNPAPTRRPADAVLLTQIREGILAVEPPRSLPYLPVVPEESSEIRGLTPAFVTADQLEFRHENATAAALVLEPLIHSRDSTLRSAALLRLGRLYRKAGKTAEALRAYERLAEIDAMAPAAIDARCELLEQAQDRDRLYKEAAAMYENLIHGRWPLRHAAYDFYMDQTQRRLGSRTPPRDAVREALASAAELAWNDPPGVRIVAGATPVLVLSTATGGSRRILVMPAQPVEQILRSVAPLTASLTDTDGRHVLGQAISSPQALERTPPSTRLPWTLRIVDSGAPQDVTSRRWMLISGFALLIALLATVGVVLTRAVAKEIALARMQTDFVAAVSHEFRSPLSSISQVSELLDEDRWPTPEHRKRGLQILRNESRRLRNLVESLLDFAAMESGAATYRLAPTDVCELVRDTVEEFRHTTAARTASVETQSVDDVPLVAADAEALRRALWNLLENGVKYSRAPAEVRVRICRTGDGRIAIRVSDRGIGIPRSEHREVFRKFYRSTDAARCGVKGTGIGLAMVHHIVEGHGGEIQLESEPGQGSTFSILLPEAAA